MIYEKDNFVATAYCGDAAIGYDRERFETKQGVSFDSLEWGELQRAVGKIAGGASILEVGCGTARFSKRLAESGFCVRAIDASADMIKVSSAKCRGLKNITFAEEEAAELSSEDCSFDLVFSIRVTNQIGSKEYAFGMIREMIRVAKRGGVILVEFANSNRPLKKKNKSTRLSFGEISRLGRELNCRVESRRGILIFSQTILNKMPRSLIPMWLTIEKLLAVFLWRWASRGYTILRKL